MSVETEAGRLRTVGRAGAQLHVVERGDPPAPTVLLVHGYPDTHGCWDDIAKAVGELVDHAEGAPEPPALRRARLTET